MKLGVQLGYWGASRPTLIPNSSRRPRRWFRRGIDRRGLGIRRLTPLAWWGSHTTAAARHLADAALGAHADGLRDGGAHARPCPVDAS